MMECGHGHSLCRKSVQAGAPVDEQPTYRQRQTNKRLLEVQCREQANVADFLRT